LVIRADRAKALHQFLTEQLPALRAAAGKGVRVAWDVDARHLM